MSSANIISTESPTRTVTIALQTKVGLVEADAFNLEVESAGTPRHEPARIGDDRTGRAEGGPSGAIGVTPSHRCLRIERRLVGPGAESGVRRGGVPTLAGPEQGRISTQPVSQGPSRNLLTSRKKNLYMQITKLLQRRSRMGDLQSINLAPPPWNWR